MNMGQTHLHKYMAPPVPSVEGKIDPRFPISHRVGIKQVPGMDKTWRDKQDAVTKIVIGAECGGDKGGT